MEEEERGALRRDDHLDILALPDCSQHKTGYFGGVQ